MQDQEQELYRDEPEAPETPAEETPTKEDESGEHTELVSKKLLGIGDDEQLKPGHECVLEVVKDYGKEVEVKYQTKKKMSEDDELSALAE